VVPVTAEIDAQTVIGDVYMRSLMRTQLRLALTVIVVVGGSLASVPLLTHLAPAARTIEVLGIPALWLVLGVLVYPLLLAAGWWYVRQAERTEADFVDLSASRPSGHEPGVRVGRDRDRRPGDADHRGLGLRLSRTTSDFYVASRSVGPLWNASRSAASTCPRHRSSVPPA
jgi:hypothetical protein